MRHRVLTLAGLALAVASIAAVAAHTSSPRVVLSSPDTIAVGDTVTVSATAFDGSGHRVPGAHIVWQVNPSAGVVLADSATNGQTARLTDTVSSTYTQLIAVWVDSTFTPPLTLSSPRIASASRILVAIPAIVVPVVAAAPVATHLSIYGAITMDSTKGLVIDSTAWMSMQAGDTAKSCLHIVAWTADGKPVTGLPVQLSSGDTMIVKFTPPPNGVPCPDTTVDPAVVGQQALAAPSSSTMRVPSVLYRKS